MTRRALPPQLGAAIRDAVRSVLGGEAPQAAAPQPAAPPRRA
jgi:hypothetical protein